MDNLKTCPDCGISISSQANRCGSCAAKHRWGYGGKQPTCPICGVSVSRHGRHCRSCATKQKWADPEYRSALEAAQKELWDDPEFHAKFAETQRQSWATDDGSRRKAVAKRSRAMWQAEDWRKHHAKMMGEYWANPSYCERVSAAISKGKSRPDRVEKFRQRIKAMWADPEFREQHTGKNHSAWKGGSKPWYGSYPKEFTAELRLSIRERDGFECIICGEPENGNAHHVHHIDYNKTNNDPSNLVTLCRLCHSKTNAHRATWQIAFEALNVSSDEHIASLVVC